MIRQSLVRLFPMPERKARLKRTTSSSVKLLVGKYTHDREPDGGQQSFNPSGSARGEKSQQYSTSLSIEIEGLEYESTQPVHTLFRDI